MKKILFSLSVLLSIVCLSACNSGGSAGGSGESYTIKMRLNEGDQFNNNVIMDMDMTASIVNMKMKMAFDTRFDVLKPTDSGKVVKLTYTKAEAHMDMGNLGQMGNSTDSILKSTYDRIVGKSIEMVLAPDNRITSVRGFDSLVTSIGDDEMSRETIQKMFSQEQLNSNFGMYFNLYPQKPVKIGESWTSETKMNVANIDMSVKVKYTLVSVKNGLAEIDVNGEIGGDGNMSKSGMSMSMKMSGSQKGSMTVNLADGYLQKGGYKMDIKADMETMGQKIPMTISADYRVSGK